LIQSPTAFAFNHLQQNRIFNDVRKTPTPQIDWEHCFFLGFRVRTPKGEHYHHALIVVDSSEDSFYDGIAGEFEAILNQTVVTDASDIELIFVRCLQMKDLNKVSAAERQKMDATILKSIESEADSLFVVLMQMGNARHWILEVNSQNALTALKAVEMLANPDCGEKSYPLEICLAHPVFHEFNLLFDATFARFEMLIKEGLGGSTYMH